ncbi:hypothetical protein CMI37_15630 [Candidatus Pacearchaeota archaeon]|nr:hypothetical protein [Candidatus Pacearchaeota archaeon]
MITAIRTTLEVIQQANVIRQQLKVMYELANDLYVGDEEQGEAMELVHKAYDALDELICRGSSSCVPRN